MMRSPKLVVLNSFRMLRDIYPSVIDELGDTQESIQPEVPRLYTTIQANGHTLVLTPRIRDEYSREAARNGYSGSFVQQFLAYLQEDAGVARQCRTRHPTPTRHIPSQHKYLIVDAVRTGAEYLVTYNQRWLERERDIRRSYGLHIVTPQSFIDREG